jgi:ABC-2 type transport system permease protein
MSAFGTVLAQRMRRDRVQLAIWIACTALLGLVSASAIADTYGEESARAGLIALAVANPSILLLRGLPQGAGLGAFVFFQIFTYLALLAGLMSTFLAVRHSRAEEESGRAELIASTPAARAVPTIATLVHGAIANIVLGTAVAATFDFAGLPIGGAVVTGAAVAATGVAFLSVGLLAAQVMRTSRGANALAVACVCGAFLLRGIGDALGTPSADALSMSSSWLSWLSPIGWAQHVSGWGANDSSPLLISLALAVACTGAVIAIQRSRDTGASLLAGRSGPAEAGASLSGSLALGWRLQWPTITAWCVSGTVLGMLGGSLASVIVQATTASPDLRNTLSTLAPGGTGSITQILLAAMFGLVGVVAAACGTQTMIRMHQEEAAGTAELVLSTPVSRLRWLCDYLMLGVVSILLVLLSAAVAASIAVLAVGDDPGHISDAFAEAGAQLPAALVYLAFALVVFVALPAFVAPVCWAALGAGIFLGNFGGLIGVPRWARDLSPFAHTPVVIGASTEWSGAAAMLAVAAIATAVAVGATARREPRGA